MGNKRFDKIVVIDIEATCWEPREEQGDQPSEIIEIGVCVLDTKLLDISRKRSYIVKPKLSKISAFCTQLTGHTPKSMKGGIPFGDACNKLAKEYGTKNRVWASWGDSDRLHFRKECAEKGAEYPFGEAHINLSDLFVLSMGESKRVKVSNALDMFGMKFEGKPHRGDDDAYNTARVFGRLLERARYAEVYGILEATRDEE